MNRTCRFITCSLVMGSLFGSVIQGQGPGRGPVRSDVRGMLKTVDAATGTITVSAFEGRQGAIEKTFNLAKNVEIALGDGGDRRGLFVCKEGKISDLIPGAQVSLTLTADQASVESILAEGPTIRGMLKEVNATQNTLKVTLMSQRDQEPEEKSFAMASGVEVVVDDGRGRRLSLKEGKTSDLVPGTTVSLTLSVDQKQVLSIQAEGPTLQGTIKSVDPAKNEITLTTFPRRGGEDIKEQTVVVAGDALVLLDDGRGRRLSLKEGKLSDIPAGSAVNVRLTADQKLGTIVRAEGAIVQGLIRSVDANAGTVTIVQRTGRGENPTERTLPVAKDARIVMDGGDRKLADIKVADNGPFAMLRLSLDQKTVQSIVVNQPR